MNSIAAHASDRRSLAELVLWGCIAFGFYIRWAWGNEFTYVVFTDRDMLRALFLWDEFQVTGAELGGRMARTPGGLLYYVINLFQALSPDTRFVHGIVVALDCAALLSIPFLFAGIIGRRAALFSAALYGITPAVLENLWKFWNPSFALLFGVLFYAMLLSYRHDEGRWRLPAAFACIGIAAQFHVSFNYLVPLAILYLAVTRCRVSVLTAVASVAAYLAVFAPYIAVEVSSGWPNTQALMASVGDVRVISDERARAAGNLFEQILSGLSRLTGGRTFPLETAPAIITSHPLIYAAATLVFNLGLVLVAGVMMMMLLVRLSPKNFAAPEIAHRPAGGLVFLFVVSVLLSLTFDNAQAGRYLLFIVVPGLLIAGIGFDRMTAWAARRWNGTVAAMLALAVAGLVLVRYGAVSYYYAVSPRESHSSFAVKNILVETLKRDFGFTNHDIDTRVAMIFVGPAGPYFIEGGENLGLSYIARTTKVAAASVRYDGCVAMIANNRRADMPPDIDASTLSRVLPGTDAIRVERSVKVRDLLIVGYRRVDANCPYHGNAYFLTSEEKVIEAALAGVKPGAVREMTRSGTARRFVTAFDTGVLTGLMVEISRQGGRVGTKIHGNAFRGYAPSAAVLRAEAEGLALRFIPADGGKIIVLNGPQRLGVGGLKTPWDLGAMRLAPGDYRVELRVAGVKTRLGKSAPQTIQLTDRYTVGAE